MPEIADPRLIEAHDVALAALREITPAATIGAPAGYTVEEGGAVSLRFATTLSGYPGWFWTVSVARVDDEDPTVLEAELLPGDGALLAPDWVPWAVRLADYQAVQAAAEAERAAAGEDPEAEPDGESDVSDDPDDAEDEADDLDDLDDLDAADFDTDGSRILHAGDVDGVDIDVLDESAEDEDEPDEDDDDADDEDDDEDALSDRR